MEQKTKIGILKYIARTGARGIKFEDEPETWYNPSTDEAKEQVKDDYQGKEVRIIITEGQKTKFSSMILNDGEIPDCELGAEADVILSEMDEEERLGETSEGVPTGGYGIKEEKASPQTPLPKEEVKPAQKTNKVSKVSKDPLKTDRAKDIVDELIYGSSPIDIMLKSASGAIMSQEYTQEDYKEMENTKLETAKKGPMKLTYASWAEVWGALKRIHPRAQYTVHENNEGMPYFYNENVGAFVKVSVTVKDVTHTMILPVMNHYNKSAKAAEIDSFLINKNIMRCLVKAVALHGIGLYVFKGEDLPEETKK